MTISEWEALGHLSISFFSSHSSHKILKEMWPEGKEDITKVIQTWHAYERLSSEAKQNLGFVIRDQKNYFSAIFVDKLVYLLRRKEA